MAQASSTLEKLAAYYHWANNRLLLHLENLGGDMPETTLQLLRHILNAQAIWLSRIKNIAPSPAPFDAPTLDQDRHLYENTSGTYRPWLPLPLPNWPPILFILTPKERNLLILLIIH